MGGRSFTEAELGEIFDRAVADGDAERAWIYADRLAIVDLPRALALTMALARSADWRFEATARRFLGRLMAEIEPTVEQIKRIADALDNFAHRRGPPALRVSAERALDDLHRQLRERG